MSLKIFFFRVYRYLRYWLLALDEHSLQSPFLFQLYTQALSPSNLNKITRPTIEELRKSLLAGRHTIANTYGSGSSLSTSQRGSIRGIAKFGVSTPKQSEILVNLIEWTKAETVLELGTSLGLNTLYLSEANTTKEVVTVEGNQELALLSRLHFESHGASNIDQINDDIDHFLDNDHRRYDLVYIDANHTLDATIRYFRKCMDLISSEGVIILDDINWSPDMNRAWNSILEDNKTCIFVENYEIGIVFVNRPSEQKHYILRF
ncbi:MAG: class I SAM-dependent methyltransferase [Reichenbachiella sp.]|uniref:O-methyltransferase n=1 Tax=Reichenbachiella sp. TaxID=2184521 RepID=UPI003267C828